MSDLNGPGQPPAYPPQQPYRPPPRPGGSGATIAAAVLAAVFVAATAILAYVAHHPDESSSASSGVSGVQSASFGADGPQVNGGDTGIAPAPSISVPSITPLPTVSSPPPLEADAINRVYQVYMNALLYHDLSALKSATCPQLRHTETGTALHHHYISRYRGKPYTIEPGLNYVRITTVVTQEDDGVKQTYQWQVVRFRGTGQYWVCGFFG